MGKRRKGPEPGGYSREALDAQIALLEGEMRAKGHLPTDDPAESGTCYRVDDAVAEPFVPLAANFVVVRRDAQGVLVMPTTLDGLVRSGDVVIPPSETPFGNRAIVVHAWCPMHISEAALEHLAPHARCPTVPSLCLEHMLLAPPPGTHEFVKGWRALIKKLEE